MKTGEFFVLVFVVVMTFSLMVLLAEGHGNALNACRATNPDANCAYLVR